MAQLTAMNTAMPISTAAVLPVEAASADVWGSAGSMRGRNRRRRPLNAAPVWPRWASHRSAPRQDLPNAEPYRLKRRMRLSPLSIPMPRAPTLPIAGQPLFLFNSEILPVVLANKKNRDPFGPPDQ